MKMKTKTQNFKLLQKWKTDNSKSANSNGNLKTKDENQYFGPKANKNPERKGTQESTTANNTERHQKRETPRGQEYSTKMKDRLGETTETQFRK